MKNKNSAIILSAMCLCLVVILSAIGLGYSKIQLRFEANDTIREIRGELTINK